MKTVIKKGENVDLFKEVSQYMTSIQTGGKLFYYLPYWIEENQEELTLHSIEDLPKDIIEALQVLRKIKTGDETQTNGLVPII